MFAMNTEQVEDGNIKNVLTIELRFFSNYATPSCLYAKSPIPT